MQLLVVLVPVIFGLLGFAIDLGILYMVRGEVKTAANAMALAAAQQLIGTDASLANANTAALSARTVANGGGNKYYFGGYTIGDTNGQLSSVAEDPAYFDTLSSATDSTGGGTAGGTTARYAKATITADAPLLFFGFLQAGQERRTTIASQAVAGISAPLCTACAIEVLAVAAVDPSDNTDFGFIPATRYTFAFQCTGTPTPSVLPNAGSLLSYLLLNRLDSNARIFTDEQSQLYRIGAQGLPGTSTQTQGCISVNNQEQIWATAAPTACSTAVPQPVTSFLCGVESRFDPATSASTGLCAQIPEVDTMSSVYTADTDPSDLDDYTAYTGSRRRILNVVVVDALAAGGTMTVLGFRQFLIEPNQNDVNISPGDTNGRFAGLYIGNPVPLKQGAFGSCNLTAGPGKVVLHQ